MRLFEHLPSMCGSHIAAEMQSGVRENGAGEKQGGSPEMKAPKYPGSNVHPPFSSLAASHRIASHRVASHGCRMGWDACRCRPVVQCARPDIRSSQWTERPSATRRAFAASHQARQAHQAIKPAIVPAGHGPSERPGKQATDRNGKIAPAAAIVRRCLSIPKWRDVGVPLSAAAKSDARNLVGGSKVRCRKLERTVWRSTAAKCGARNLNALAVVVGMRCQELERTICSAVVRVMVIVVRRSSRRQQSLQPIKTTAD